MCIYLAAKIDALSLPRRKRDWYPELLTVGERSILQHNSRQKSSRLPICHRLDGIEIVVLGRFG
jgi:hypothetical protein